MLQKKKAGTANKQSNYIYDGMNLVFGVKLNWSLEKTLLHVRPGDRLIRTGGRLASD